MSEITEKALAFLNDKEAAIWSIPPELLPDYIESKPERAKRLVQSTERIVEIAAELGQWDALHQAIKFLMACQQAVLDWWGNNVQGVGRPKSSPDPGMISIRAATKIIGFSDSSVSRWRQSLQQPERYEEHLIAAARRKAGLEPAENHLAEGTGDNEWFTPAQYIAAARIVMGNIDLDPASHKKAQETVQADKFYTQQDNGLKHEWHGSVWLNPPYSKGLIGPFVEKLVSELDAKRATKAIMLTHNSTDTEWFHLAESRAALLCFTHGRIRFLDTFGQECSPTQGQTFFYFGDATEEFRDIFGTFGFVR